MSASASSKASGKAHPTVEPHSHSHPTVKPLWTTHLSPSHPAWRPPVATGGGVNVNAEGAEVHGGESLGAGAAHIHIHTQVGLRDRLDAAAEEALRDVAATSIQAASRGRAGRRAAASARDAAYADADHSHSHSHADRSESSSSPGGRHGGRLTGTAEVIVPDYQLSLAIGKEGQNARLAARLTGWRVDIKSETQLAEEEAYANQDWAEGEWVVDAETGEQVWQPAEGGEAMSAEAYAQAAEDVGETEAEAEAEVVAEAEAIVEAAEAEAAEETGSEDPA